MIASALATPNREPRQFGRPQGIIALTGTGNTTKATGARSEKPS